jgi:alkylation response protein AidB-like acyl-CoA dehydrogenase
VYDREDALRQRARVFATDAVARHGRSNDSWINGFSKGVAKELAAEGWIGMTWPVAFGGGGRPPIDRLVIRGRTDRGDVVRRSADGPDADRVWPPDRQAEFPPQNPEW